MGAEVYGSRCLKAKVKPTKAQPKATATAQSTKKNKQFPSLANEPVHQSPSLLKKVPSYTLPSTHPSATYTVTSSKVMHGTHGFPIPSENANRTPYQPQSRVAQVNIPTDLFI